MASIESSMANITSNSGGDSQKVVCLPWQDAAASIYKEHQNTHRCVTGLRNKPG